MKIGILADIHEAVEPLRMAVAALRERGAERIVVLGDVLELGEHLGVVTDLLDAAGAIGVWGNHDFGLCKDPPPLAHELFPTRCIEFFGRLRPRLEIEECLFTHVAPYLDPEKLDDLWSFEFGSPESLARSFAAVPHRILCVGHAHRWFLATPERVLPWKGEAPVQLDADQRYLIEFHAVLWGWCAFLDTQTGILEPIDLRCHYSRVPVP